MFHDELGYWMWDPESGTIMHSLVIPRGVCVLAGGIYRGEKNDDGMSIIEVEATVEDSDWNITQSPFMSSRAKTTAFSHKVEISGGKMNYKETIFLDIYGKPFEHTDQNELTLQ